MVCKDTCRCLVTIIMMNPVSTRNVTGPYGMGNGLLTFKCDSIYIIDTGNNLATRPKSHCTIREEVKLVLQWKKEVYPGL